ncbi:MAG TPA: tRNA (adenosine(37)-N6)-threonylcarbamoyltransferase complex dimerization subunit type 1 TsaB [Pirellulales bacterium]
MTFRLLAIESSQGGGSLALRDGDRLVATRTIASTERTVQTLAPRLQEILQSAGWSPRDVQVVAVGVGPGSFTGVRIAVATAKSFAWAIGAQIIAVETFDALAAGATNWTTLSAAVDAQRGQVYAARFTRPSEDAPATRTPVAIVNESDWLASLPPGGLVVGAALDKLAAKLPSHAVLAPEEQRRATAVGVAIVASARIAAGSFDDVWKLQPLYIRQSAAEEVWDKKHGPRPTPKA